MLLIALCFVLVAVGVGGVAVVSRFYARQGAEQTEILTGRFLPGLVTLARLQEATLKLNGIILQFALGKDEVAMNTQKAAFQAQSASIAQYVGELKAADDSEQTRTLAAAFVAAVQTYSAAAEKLQAQLKAGDFEKAMATLDKEVAAGKQTVETQLRLLSEHLFELSQGSGQTTNKLIVESSRFSTLASIALVGATVFFLGVTIVGSRNITRRMLQVASSLGEGASQVTSAATQVSTSSQSLAQGANEQAASLEETSSSLEQMAGMTNRNAENATKASELAKQACNAADTGAGDMQAMSTAMTEIKTSSDDIAKIIKTIDEIAFQTNILALNAAVEAARAGEAGAGFAVVADEVRSLAQRSAQAARETADKIEGAINKTAQGVDISGKVARSLTEIVEKVRQVDQLVAEVSTASREQSQGVTQITTAVAQMDKVVQNNAANAEESASAAEELNAQSLALQDAVGELLQLVGNGANGAFGPAKSPKARPLSAAAPVPTPAAIVPPATNCGEGAPRMPMAKGNGTHVDFFRGA